MLAYYVHHLSPFIVEFGHGFGIRWYGTAYVLGFLCGYQLLCWMARKGYSQLPYHRGMPLGGIGGRPARIRSFLRSG
jgi:prolipoprotein diacylglyceryltransferase